MHAPPLHAAIQQRHVGWGQGFNRNTSAHYNNRMMARVGAQWDAAGPGGAGAVPLHPHAVAAAQLSDPGGNLAPMQIDWGMTS